MKNYLTLCGLLAAGHLAAQGVPVFTLQDCIVRAVEQSFDIQMLHNEQEAARINFARGNAGYLPSVTAIARANGEAWQWKEAARAETYLAGVGIEWNAFDGYKKRAIYEWLRETKAKSELSVSQTAERLIAEVTALYYDLVRRRLTAHNMRKSIMLSHYRLRIAEEKFWLGATSRLEMLQAEADLNADSSAYVVYVEETRQLKIKLKQRLHIPFGQKISIADSVIPLRGYLDIEEMRGRTLAQNIGLQIFGKNRTLAHWERLQAESERYPYLNISGRYGYSGVPYGSPNRIGLTYEATLGFRIYDGGSRRRRERTAELQENTRDLEYQRYEQQIMADLHTLYSSYINNLDLIKMETANSRLAEEKAGLAIEQYQRGQLSSIEMREFQRTLLESQNRLVTALYQAKYAEVYIMELCAMAASYLNDDDNAAAPSPVSIRGGIEGAPPAGEEAQK